MYVIHKLGAGFYNKKTGEYESIGINLEIEIDFMNYTFKDKPVVSKHASATIRAIELDEDEFRYIIDEMEAVRNKAESRLEDWRCSLSILLGKSLWL